MPSTAGYAQFIAAVALASAGMAALPTPTAFAEPPMRWQTIDGSAVRLAQSAQRPPVPSPKPHAPPRPRPAEQTEPAMPVRLEQALYLIRSTLLTLNDANRSGNYSVMRDLAAPGFHVRNTAADLALIFADLRRRGVDLFAVALMAPELAAAPSLDDKGMLRLTGHFPTQPLQIKFDLLFQNVDNQWRLLGISVQTPEVAPQANVPPTPKRPQ